MDINKLIKDARADTSLQHTVNIQHILDSVDDKNDHLENKTLEDISSEIYDTLSDIKWIPRAKLEKMCEHLLDYRLVDEVYKMHLGKVIKVLRVNPIPTEEKIRVVPAGIVMNVSFSEYGTQVMTKQIDGKFYKYNFNNFIFFQKLSSDEQMILMLNEEINS
jgi:hypothetical protein